MTNYTYYTHIPNTTFKKACINKDFIAHVINFGKFGLYDFGNVVDVVVKKIRSMGSFLSVTIMLNDGVAETYVIPKFSVKLACIYNRFDKIRAREESRKNRKHNRIMSKSFKMVDGELPF